VGEELLVLTGPRPDHFLLECPWVAAMVSVWGISLDREVRVDCFLINIQGILVMESEPAILTSPFDIPPMRCQI
jgi:hypothetical protein